MQIVALGDDMAEARRVLLELVRGMRSIGYQIVIKEPKRAKYRTEMFYTKAIEAIARAYEDVLTKKIERVKENMIEANNRQVLSRCQSCLSDMRERTYARFLRQAIEILFKHPIVA